MPMSPEEILRIMFSKGASESEEVEGPDSALHASRIIGFLLSKGRVLFDSSGGVSRVIVDGEGKVVATPKRAEEEARVLGEYTYEYSDENKKADGVLEVQGLELNNIKLVGIALEEWDWRNMSSGSSEPESKREILVVIELPEGYRMMDVSGD